MVPICTRLPLCRMPLERLALVLLAIAAQQPRSYAQPVTVSAGFAGLLTTTDSGYCWLDHPATIGIVGEIASKGVLST